MADKRKRKHEIDRAMKGLWPYQKKPPESLFMNRKDGPPTPWHRVKICANSECGVRFVAGWKSKLCKKCRGEEIRAAERKRYIFRRMKQGHPKPGTMAPRFYKRLKCQDCNEAIIGGHRRKRCMKCVERRDAERSRKKYNERKGLKNGTLC